jgi:hypothetical protein
MAGMDQDHADYTDPPEPPRPPPSWWMARAVYPLLGVLALGALYFAVETAVDLLGATFPVKVNTWRPGPCA